MIDLATAKAHLHVEHSADDTTIGVYLSAAKATIEDATSKFFAPTEVTQTLDGFPRACAGDRPIRLWNGPVFGDDAIVSIAYDDRNGAAQTLDDFRLVEGDNAKLLPAYGERWPLTICGEGSVRVTYTAGYADGEVPPALDQAVLFLVGHYYLNREAVSSGPGAAAVELPLTVEDMIKRYRTPRLG